MNKLKILLLFTAGVGAAAAAPCIPVSQGQQFCIPDPAATLTAGNYVKWNATKTGITNGATTDTAGLVLGIVCVAAAGSSGQSVIVYTYGGIPCGVNVDGTVTNGDYLGVSTTTPGQLKDIGATGSDQTVAWGTNPGSLTGANPYSAFFFGHLPNAIPTATFTSGPVADPGGSAYYLFNNAAGALTFNLPTGVPGMQRCYRESTGKSGAITIAVTTGNAIDLNGVNGTTTTGTLVSSGALGQAVCLVSDATSHWMAYPSQSTGWTNN